LQKFSNSVLLALAATVLVFLWQALTVHFNYSGNWTALFDTGDKGSIPADLRAGTYVFQNSDGYDGQAYRYIAHDPFFQRGYAANVDGPALRYRRILQPGLAFLLAGGQQRLIDGAYIAVVLFAIFFGVYWSSVYAAELRGRHFAWGLLFLLSPGAIASIDREVIDGLMTALFAGFLVYTKRQDTTKLYVILTLACLARETGFLLIVGVAAAELLRRSYIKALLFGAAAVPALVWYAFVRLHTETYEVPSIFAMPGVGLIQRLFTVRPVPDPVLHTVIQVLDVLSLLGLIASLVLAVRWIWKLWPGPVAITTALFVMLGLIAGSPAHLFEAYGYARPLSPLMLFVMLQAVASGFWIGLAPPLLVSANLAIFFVSPILRILKALI
jgi:hypothetical protein